jgi:hypothetical protein
MINTLTLLVVNMTVKRHFRECIIFQTKLIFSYSESNYYFKKTFYSQTILVQRCYNTVYNSFYFQLPKIVFDNFKLSKVL